MDGHLFIYGGQDKNLTFVTTTKGYVNVNGENLFGIVQNAKIATALIKNLKYTALNKLEDDMKSIAFNLEQLSQRLNACESALTSFKSKVRKTSGRETARLPSPLRTRLCGGQFEREPGISGQGLLSCRDSTQIQSSEARKKGQEDLDELTAQRMSKGPVSERRHLFR